LFLSYGKHFYPKQVIVLGALRPLDAP